MAALDASSHRQLLVLANELHRVADELRCKEFASGTEIFAKIDKTKRTSEEALLGEKKRVRGEPALTAIIDKIEKLKNDAAKHMAAIDEIQMEKMGKTPVEALSETDKVVSAIDKILMEKCAESDPPAGVNGKHRLSDEYVGFILAMPRDNPDDIIPYYDRCSTLAEVMGEEWLEEEKRLYKEGAERSRRIHNDFVQFQTWVLKQWLQKGYVEVDEEFLTNADELEEFGRELWEQLTEKPDSTFADRDDSVYVVPYDPVEQARVLLLE